VIFGRCLAPLRSSSGRASARVRYTAPAMSSQISRRPAGAPEPLSLRTVLSLAAGKTAARATRLIGRGGGTAITGMVARRVDPNILDKLVRRAGVPVVAITGSNGKTTTARFAAALLRGEGIAVRHNSAGANLVQGVTSLAVSAADWRGRLPDGVLVVEVDEGALPRVAPETMPRALLVTDLFRDQLDRFGEIYAVADAIESVALARWSPRWPRSERAGASRSVSPSSVPRTR
jgi:UDP-N-acetylmuramyl tripeptide synthase